MMTTLETYKGINLQVIEPLQKDSCDTLVLLHGALADERMWAAHTKILSQEFRVISITQRHFGKNGSNSMGSFGIDTHADDLISFLDENFNKAVHLVAWSYGADVALNAAIKSPTLVKSLFVYEPGYPGHLDSKEMNTYMQDAEAMFGSVFQAISDENLKEAVEYLIDGSGNNIGYFSSQSPEYRTQQLDNAHTLPLQLSQTEQPTLDKVSLAKIQIPTTVAFGAESRPLFIITSKSAGNHIPNSKLIEVSSANHMLPLENPQQFIQLVKEHTS
ncbi:alpha/beta hydrolase [Microbulbifer sp. OS29]|uniref:Alpha/beta hydrolase n=1 Tax=Microbulbifer okhotskensis TaxID=2926617 RepID=A0A9X2ERM7_9GAMM|nr:alpha/beta hydrolase [Microbulbifer okhotskensis]MCO1336551.1 alpha/beta hydrolase [Microbulbifer okhotskensis]